MERKYYFTEVSNADSYRQPEELTAETLTDAKIAASCLQVFHDTWLKLGAGIDSTCIKWIAVKKPNGIWEKL